MRLFSTDATRTRSRALAPLTVATVTGLALSAFLADELDDLADRCAAPATAGGAWLAATLSELPGPSSWALVVRDANAVPRAAIVLVDESRAAGTTVSLAGCAGGHRSAVLAQDHAAAALLADAFGESLRTRGRPLRVELGPVDSDAPWLDVFATAIPGAHVGDLDPIPGVRRMAGCDVDGYLSPAVRRTLRKAANRLQTDGKRAFISFTRDPGAIGELIPQLEEVHRERDHAQGRRSELDDAVARRIWRARLTRLAADGLLELATLQIDGDLAAEVIAVVDRTAYRVLEGILVTRWSRYAPGRVLESAVLQRVLHDPALDYLDWMTSFAPESLLAANDAHDVSVLRLVQPADDPLVRSPGEGRILPPQRRPL